MHVRCFERCLLCVAFRKRLLVSGVSRVSRSERDAARLARRLVYDDGGRSALRETGAAAAVAGTKRRERERAGALPRHTTAQNGGGLSYQGARRKVSYRRRGPPAAPQHGGCLNLTPPWSNLDRWWCGCTCPALHAVGALVVG